MQSITISKQSTSCISNAFVGRHPEAVYLEGFGLAMDRQTEIPSGHESLPETHGADS